MIGLALCLFVSAIEEVSFDLWFGLPEGRGAVSPILWLGLLVGTGGVLLSAACPLSSNQKSLSFLPTPKYKPVDVHPEIPLLELLCALKV
jgi:hypothetical protein